LQGERGSETTQSEKVGVRKAITGEGGILAGRGKINKGKSDSSADLSIESEKKGDDDARLGSEYGGF